MFLKKHFLKLAVIISILVVSGVLWGCNNVKKAEEELGVSYNNIVCRYKVSRSYGSYYECFPINYVVYGDNRVVVYAGPAAKELGMDIIYEESFEITEEEKLALIDTIQNNKIIKLEDVSTDSCDGAYHSIILYDENGNQVHVCKGLNPSNKHFKAVAQEITSLVPEGTSDNVREKALEIVEEKVSSLEDESIY